MKKVYGGNEHFDGKQRRIIVCAKTKKQAIEILNKNIDVSVHRFNNYWTETANEREIEVCGLDEVWYQESRLSDNFVKIC